MISGGAFWPASSALFLMITLLMSPGVNLTHSHSLVGSGRTDFFELSVIHLNDFHARFEQSRPSSGTCNVGYEDTCVGGFPRLYTAVNQLVNERPNSIFLNAGDHFQGTLWYNIHRWNATAHFMNMLPHDAITLGNHDFDDRIAGVVPFIKAMNTPVVVTNIDASLESDFQGLCQNSTIIERNGTRIGIIGVIPSTTNTMSNTENLIFLDEVETVNDEAGRLKAQGVDIIIVLSHSGLDVDRVMATNCPNVDLIVGGHTHSFLYTGTPPDSYDNVVDEYPVVVTQNETERTVLIVQAGAYTKYLGNLTVRFDTEGEVAGWEGNPILLNSTWKQDPDILSAMVPWQAAIDARGKVVVGSTNVRLYNNCYEGECNIGNLITDAMVDAWVEYAENSTYWTYAAIAVTSGARVRTTIEATPGVITYSELAMNQPFENTWDVVELQGSAIIQILERSVATSSGNDHFHGPNFLQWSGIKVIYNLTNPAYSRVVSLKIRCRTHAVPDYEDVNLDEWYRVVAGNFLIDGGDGFLTFPNEHRNRRMGTLDIDNYVTYVRKMSPINLGIENRQVFQ